jgi:hypothetical protein
MVSYFIKLDLNPLVFSLKMIKIICKTKGENDQDRQNDLYDGRQIMKAKGIDHFC